MAIHIKKGCGNVKGWIWRFLKKLLSYVNALSLARSLEVPSLRHTLYQIKMYLEKSRISLSVFLNYYHFRNLKTALQHFLCSLIKCVLNHLKSYSETRKKYIA